MAQPSADSAQTVFLPTIDSTNAEALRRARCGERGPLWVVAREQTAGRGRRGRPWVSPAGNLHATLLVTDPAPPAAAPQLGFVAGLALHDAATAAAPALNLRLKWPNDLLCGGAKIAGILIEGEGAPLAAAIGIGVNCRAYPADADYPATDFAAEGATVTSEALFAGLAAAMERRLAQWNRGAGFAAIRAAWLDRADGVGGPIRVRLADRAAHGEFVTIDDAGRLMLRHDGRSGSDALEAIAAGEVFPLRLPLPHRTPAVPVED